MNITPKDILEKEFSKKFNGYDQEQVDEFLDEIIKQFESLLEENENIIAKNEELKSEVARLKQKADKLENVEEKLMATVITAQRNATLYIEKAELQAQKIMDVANQNAKTVIESTQLRMEAAKQEIRRYEKQVADYKRRFRLFLDEQMAYAESKLDDEAVLKHQATEISQSISNLTNQIADIDSDSQNTSIHLNEILKQSKEETEHDFKQSTANLQEIVNEIIDD
ncbi:DivIVA domain-containing protein [Christensenella tenuis]|uniref:DivIVA domain-containing protein n=1 Tax=Christensenella tenuis TaxID=2763033 RepID=A0ABR7EAW1_9FIRM|nr:DivIVA domain-containing protein [Christensenella tenuis]MBC5646923.1 DivIVA domain-containing protein [Christensenella tenuis]